MERYVRDPSGMQRILDISAAKKKANDFALAKDIMDFYDNGYTLDNNRFLKIEENYQLHSGRWPNIEQHGHTVEFNHQGENIVLGGGALKHYPIINQASKRIVSNIILKPLITVVKDYSSRSSNARNRFRLERIKQYFQQTVIQPNLERITAEYYNEYGIIDPYSLTIEQQQQMGADIQNRLQEQTPKEILEAMDKYKTPDEILAEKLLDYTIQTQRVKSKFDQGGENAVVTAEEYYRVSLLNNSPYLEVLNPKWVTWYGSEHVTNSEDGTFARYEQYLTPEETISKYALDLLRKDVKQIQALYSPMPGTEDYIRKHQGKDAPNSIEYKIVDMYADHPELQHEIDIRTREGQDKLKHLYSNLTGKHRTNWGVRESYITWKWTRRLKVVQRIENDKVQEFIRDEHYVKQPGDYKVRTILAPQVWEGTKLGEGNSIYVNVRSLPNQYLNPNDPTDVKLSIFGGKYDTSMNNVEPVSFIDLGKPMQYKYDQLMKVAEESEATDFGKALLATVNSIPDGWSMTEWLNSLRYGKLALLQTAYDGFNNIDANIFKSIDLSNNEHLEIIQKLDYFEDKIYSSMFTSKASVGDISPYSTNQNIQASLASSDRVMVKFHDRHKQIKEKVLTQLMYLSLFGYRNNEEVKAAVLDDFTRAHYEVNEDFPDVNNFTLFVVDSFQETENVNFMKARALELLQNGLINFRDLAALTESDSMAEIIDIAEQAEKRAQQMQQARAQEQERIMQLTEEMRQKSIEIKEMYEIEKVKMKNAANIASSQIQATLLENSNDIDRDRINDSYEKAVMQEAARAKEEDKKREFEAGENEKDRDLKRYEINKRS